MNKYIIYLDSYDTPIIEAKDYKEAFLKIETWVSNKPNEVFRKALNNMSSVEEMVELFENFYDEEVRFVCKLEDVIELKPCDRI